MRSQRFLSMWDLIDHVQIGNPPDRCEPGAGKRDYNHVFSLIRSSDYRGWIGGEFIPSTSATSASLGWMRAQLLAARTERRGLHCLSFRVVFQTETGRNGLPQQPI